MKRFVRALVVLGLLGPCTLAQLPSKISYQGRLLDETGTPVDGKVSLVFTLFDAPTAGSALWTELHEEVNVTDGVFDVVLGSNEPLDGISFSSALYLGIQVNGQKLGEPTLLMSAPHALGLRGLAVTPVGTPGGELSVNLLAGGVYNAIRNDALGAVVAGGGSVTGAVMQGNAAQSSYSTVSGGAGNKAGDDGGLNDYATVGGGSGNAATGMGSTISGGVGNQSSGPFSAVGGGGSNVAGTGMYATVPGGRENQALGNGAFAAGRCAQANTEGSFVWNDGCDEGPMIADQPYRFLVRARAGVGINTNTPRGTLHVNGGIIAREGEPGAGGALNNGYAFYGDSGGKDSGLFSRSPGEVSLFTDNYERITVATNGPSASTIDIGSEEQAAFVRVWGVQQVAGRVVLDAPEADPDISFYGAGGVIRNAINVAEDGEFSLWPDGSKRLLLSADGNLGLGAPTPSTRLHVAGPGTDAGGVSGSNEIVARFQRPAGWHTGISVDAATGQDAVLHLAEDGSSQWNLRHDAGTGTFQLRRPGNTPTEVLEVAATAPNNWLRPGSDNVFALGSSDRRWTAVHATNGTIQTSDARLKRDIRPSSYGLEAVMHLTPVSYRWNEGDDPSRHLGLLAQEVLNHVPEVVSEGGDEQAMLGLNYGELVPVLIRAIQEQQAAIDSMREEMETLRRALSER